MKKAHPIVVGNWKLYITEQKDAKNIFLSIKRYLSSNRAGSRSVNVVVCPPVAFLPELQKTYSGKKIAFGVQDISYHRRGAYTGEMGASLISSIGATWAIVGHSERRAMGETNEIVAEKLSATLREGMHGILCIGEGTRDREGTYLSFLKTQLLSALVSLEESDIKKLVIAYEPIWAIGKDRDDAIRPDSLHEMSIFIRKVLTERYSQSIAFSIPILYGGSVDEGNVHTLYRDGHVNGFLLGRASVNPQTFLYVIKSLQKKS